MDPFKVEEMWLGCFEIHQEARLWKVLTNSAHKATQTNVTFMLQGSELFRLLAADVKARRPEASGSTLIFGSCSEKHLELQHHRGMFLS